MSRGALHGPSSASTRLNRLARFAKCNTRSLEKAALMGFDLSGAIRGLKRRCIMSARNVGHHECKHGKIYSIVTYLSRGSRYSKTGDEPLGRKKGRPTPREISVVPAGPIYASQTRYARWSYGSFICSTFGLGSANSIEGRAKRMKRTGKTPARQPDDKALCWWKWFEVSGMVKSLRHNTESSISLAKQKEKDGIESPDSLVGKAEGGRERENGITIRVCHRRKGGNRDLLADRDRI
ncbi:hypothetical protein EI94DRAFT_1704994 [Lactarius quietus]|nr:hypothetical protein EI94DRAFT_1704994 [Lactarius quietus]